jgi:hypothetical protein
MKHVVLILLSCMLFIACGDGKKEAAEQLAREEQAVMHVVDLSGHDVPLLVELDRNMVQQDTPRVWYNEEFGRLEVDAGDRFRIVITEEEGDVQRLKTSLERDMLRRTTIIEESPGLVVWRSEFPADEIVFVHFYQVIAVGDRTFVVESHDQGRFNEADIRRMATSVVVADHV